MKFSVEVYTPLVDESRQFYCQVLGFEVKSELDGFVVLQHHQRPEYELMFCVPDSPFVHEIFHPRFAGDGILFQIEVNNVENEFQRIQDLGISIALPLTEEPVNGKHFTVTDPSGILIDVVQE